MKDMQTEVRVGSLTNKIEARGVQVYYGQNHALRDVDVDILDKTVTAFIGPSGCGKSTFLRCLKPDERHDRKLPGGGRITLEAEDIYDPRCGPGATARQGGHGVPKSPKPFSEIHL